MMEAIAIEVLGAGGKVHILATTDGERRYRAQRLPLEYLGPPPSSIDSALILQSDLEINLPYDSDFRSIWPDVTSERFRRHQRSNPILSRLNEQSARRYLYLAMPTQPDVVAAVRQAGVDSAAYDTLWWDAAITDVAAIRQRGRTIARLLGAGGQVQVTTPEGTDFTFAPGDAPADVDAENMSRTAARTRPWARRQAAFPVGLVTVLANPRTVNGRVRDAADQCDQAVTGETFELRAGRPETIRAATEEACVREGLTRAGSVGFLSIGLNPAMEPVLSPKGNFLPEQSLGLVSLGFGNNVQFGGTDSGPRWVVPLTRATVTVDGVLLVEDGQHVDLGRSSDPPAH
jgi:leucyl aminopeptidase (aminopeptidase T)